MMFFKELMDEKMADPSFNTLFKQECHICTNTVKLISRFEDSEQELGRILAAAGISSADWDNLKNGDYCEPDQVFRLCETIGLNASKLMSDCPRRTKK